MCLEDTGASPATHFWEKVYPVLDICEVIYHLLFNHKLLQRLFICNIINTNEDLLALLLPLFLGKFLEELHTKHFY